MKEPLYSSIILKSDDMTLTLYQGKPFKKVLLLNTMHRAVAIEKEKKKLPGSVIYYNTTKSGVDNVDQIARLSTSRGSCWLWSVQVFL